MFNQVILIGRLTKKPELKKSETTGLKYLKATLAVKSQRKNRDGIYETEFIDFTAFGKIAQNISNYCDKGSLINLVGSLSNNSYTDKNGVNRHTIAITANQVNFLSKTNKREEIKDEEAVFTLGQ